jgi:hypothetical protein
MIFLEEDAAAEIMVGPFVSETDGVTPQTGINWSNANIEFTKMVGGVPTSSAITDHGVAGVNEIAELQDGYYRIKLTATNLNTAGPAYITFRDDDIFLAVMHSFTIMAAAAYQWLIYRGDSSNGTGDGRFRSNRGTCAGEAASKSDCRRGAHARLHGDSEPPRLNGQ